MSAIDFTLNVEKQEDPEGDRVKTIRNLFFRPFAITFCNGDLN